MLPAHFFIDSNIELNRKQQQWIKKDDNHNETSLRQVQQ